MLEFLANTDGAHDILQAVRWPCEPIILSIGYFESPIEVQRIVGERPLASDEGAVT